MIEEDDGDARRQAIEDQLEHYLDLMDVEDLMRLVPRIAERATSSLRTDYPQEGPISEEEVREALRELERDSEDGDTHASVPTSPQDRDAELLLEEWPTLTTTTRVRDRRAPILVREEPIGPGEAGPGLETLVDGVFRVDRLREVRAFEGFTRVDNEGDLVFPNLGASRPTWLPAVEVFGEGVFLRFNETALREWESIESSALEDRLRAVSSSFSNADGFLARLASREPVLSRFILVHTFSHMLIRQLCYECGYSAASLRERLYVFPDRAGVLIYTADGDSEGSLGGLVRQGDWERLQATVQAGLERAAWCSNDPICSEMPEHGPGKTNRAACHACVLVSETSCTEMNALLDRELVIGEGGRGHGRPKGYFRKLIENAGYARGEE